MGVMDVIVEVDDAALALPSINNLLEQYQIDDVTTIEVTENSQRY